jgi:alpha-tubulin suppressor-like RCC1 family protein
VLKRVAAGESHACGIRSNGELVCWGGFYGETIAAPGGSFSELACGAEASCALDADGYATCWGAFPGELAQPPNVALSAIAVGRSAACGVRLADSKLTCWGPSAPASVPEGTFSAVALGSDYGCALTTVGAIICWDSGLGTEPSGDFSALSAGSAHACALGSPSGTVTCWGADGSGETDAVTGVFQKVVAGGSTSCGLKNSAIVCWGYDLGTPPKGSFQQLTLGSDFGCALDASGHVHCWGNTSYGGDHPPLE